MIKERGNNHFNEVIDRRGLSSISHIFAFQGHIIKESPSITHITIFPVHNILNFSLSKVLTEATLPYTIAIEKKRYARLRGAG